MIAIQPSCQLRSKTSPWTKEALLFSDTGTEQWQEKWFLDGTRSKVINTDLGMELLAGPEAKNDTCHTVLWTKDTFNGDICIEYEYTRTDTSNAYVNIIYFHAQGSGEEGFPEDITLWNDARRVPSMRTYFRHMKTYHISYATGSGLKDSITDDYVRLRRYDPSLKRLKGSDIPKDNFNTGLFKRETTYKIKIVKFHQEVHMQVTNSEDDKETANFKWDISKFPSYEERRIGLRHMYTRSARYRNFNAWSLR